MKLTPQRLEAPQGVDQPMAYIGRQGTLQLSDVDEWVRAGGADDEHNNAGGATARNNGGPGGAMPTLS